LTAGAAGISGALSVASCVFDFLGKLLKYLPTPDPFAVLAVLLAPAGLLNQLPTPSSSMSSGPASFSACADS